MASMENWSNRHDDVKKKHVSWLSRTTRCLGAWYGYDARVLHGNDQVGMCGTISSDTQQFGLATISILTKYPLDMLRYSVTEEGRGGVEYHRQSCSNGEDMTSLREQKMAQH